MSTIFPKVLQAVASDDFTVFAYMNDGTIRCLDAKPYIARGGVFAPLGNADTFTRALTVLNDTVAWDLSGNHDAGDCIDIDPFTVQAAPVAADPLVDKAV